MHLFLTRTQISTSFIISPTPTCTTAIPHMHDWNFDPSRTTESLKEDGRAAHNRLDVEFLEMCQYNWCC